MMVVDIYVEGDESDADMEWHNHGSTCVEWARNGGGVHICASKSFRRKILFSYVC